MSIVRKTGVKRERAMSEGGTCSALSIREPPPAGAVWSRDQLAEIRKEIETEEATYVEAEERLASLREGVASAEERLAMIRRSSGPMLALNVGGCRFDVPRRTLLAEPDSFFHRLLEGNFPVDIDRDDCIVVDRDSHTFKHVLNYLRGYRRFSSLSQEERAMLAADADYYQLPGLKALVGPDQGQARLLFCPGPGVNLEGNRIRVVYCIGVVGERHLMVGKHRITFEILNGEYVGLGVASDACVAFDQEFHKTANCCVYYMTGVFYTNFPHHRKEENLEKYNNGDRVTLTLDMDEKVLEFKINKYVKIVSCASASRLRFAVAMKLGSHVRIVPDGETQEESALQILDSSSTLPSS